MQHITTQEKFLLEGKKEFLAEGYRGASLRSIAKSAGFTLGAFYGYFPDKASLFAALVEPAASELLMQFRLAQDTHFELIDQKPTVSSRDLSNEYLHKFLDYIYQNFDAFKLVICCAEGTAYENYQHKLIDIEVDCTMEYYERLRALGRLEGEVSRELHHMLTSAYFNAVFETVRHDMPFEKAQTHVDKLSAFFTGGWNELIKMR